MSSRPPTAWGKTLKSYGVVNHITYRRGLRFHPFNQTILEPKIHRNPSNTVCIDRVHGIMCQLALSRIFNSVLPDSGMHDAFPETLVPIKSLPSLSTHQQVSPLLPSSRHCMFSYDPSFLQRGLKRDGIAWLVYPRARRRSFRQADNPAVI